VAAVKRLVGLICAFGLAAPGFALEVEDARRCIAANAPQTSLVMRIGLALEHQGRELSATRFQLLWLRVDTGEQRALMRFQTPADLAGASLLMVLRDGRSPLVDLLLPELGQPQRISSREQLDGFLGRAGLGSEEVGVLLDPLAIASGTLLSDAASMDGRPAWQIERRSPEGEPGRYARTVSYIDRETCVPLRVEFYDRADRLRKRLLVPRAEVSQVSYSWQPRRWIFEDAAGGSRSVLNVEEVELDRPLAARMLTRRALTAPER
jgi:hypothetical protein